IEGGRGRLSASNRPLLFTRMSDNHLFELPSEVMTEINEAQINTVIPPYKGLRYFEEQDAERFFGREEVTAQLVEHLSASPFLALIGASGSGKSSLLRAGLLPALRQKEVAPPSVRLITPTAHPLEALGSILTPDHDSESERKALVEHLTQNPRTLALYADQLICQSEAEHASAMLRRDSSATSATMAPLPLLVVDQFEELFTLCHNPVAREAFVDNLMAAVAGKRIMVVIALRSDYYAPCTQFDQLRQLLERQQKLIGPLSGHQWRRAIEEPARQGGWALEEGLLETLLQGGRTEADALPRLSHALLETWQRREGQTLTLAGYAAAGGMEGAIAESAERVFKKTTLKERAITRSIFLRLIKVGGHAPSESVSRDSTRRATLTELLQSGRRHDAPIVEEVINTLADGGLITIHHAISPDPCIAKEGSPSPSIGRGGRGGRAVPPTSSPSPSIGRGGRGVRALDRSPSPSIGRGGRGVRALDRSPSPSIGIGGWGVRAVPLITFDGDLDGDHVDQVDHVDHVDHVERNQAPNGHQKRDGTPDLAVDRLEDPRFGGSDAQFFEQRPDGQVATVEIAHEALIHHWPRLGEWLDEKRDQWRVESRLTQPARLWELNNRNPRYLYRGARLAEAQIVSDLLHLDGLKREFLEASLTQQEQEAQKGGFSMEKEPRRPIPSSKEGQRRGMAPTNTKRGRFPLGRLPITPTKWAGRLAIIGLLVMCALVVASSVFARQQWQRAEQLQQASQASELAAQAQAVRDQHPQRSLLLALEALSVSKQAEQAPLPAALQALRDALDHSGGFDLGGHASGIHVVGLTPNVYNEAHPYWLATGYGDGRVGLWDLTERRAEPALYGERAPTMELFGHQDRITAMINYHPWLITGSRDGTIRLWDMSLANPMANSILLQGHENQIESLAIAHHWLVSDSHDNTVRLWDLREPSRAPILLVSHQDYIDSALLPDANGEMRPYAITADAYKIFLWDLTADDPSLQAAVPLGTHADRMSAIALSADKRWLVTGSNDSSVRLWDLTSPLPTGGNPEPTYLQAHNNQIRVVDVTSDNRWVLTTGGQDAFLWDLSSPEIATQPIHLPGHKDEIKKAIISPDNHWLITASSRTAFLWDLHKMPGEGRQPVELRSPQDRISALAISPDSRWLVIGSYDHSAYLWDLNALGASPYRLQGHDDPIESLMISAEEPSPPTEEPSPPTPLPILGEGSTEGEESTEGEGSTEAEGGQEAHGAWLVTRSRNGSARLWDLREPVERQLTYLADQKQEPGTSRIPTAANQWMVSNQDNPPSISKLSLEQLSELACYTAARNFTQAEWVQYFPEQPVAYRQTCPNLAVHPSVIETLLAEGQVLAKESQIEDAIAKFEQAIALEPDLADLLYQAPLEPETEARRLAAETLIEEGERLVHKGEVNDALAAYEKAQEIYPQLDISGPSWNTLCRFGAPWGYPKEVMHACENAVQQDPDNGLAHNSRALARGLTGNYAGAIEDYQLFIQWSQETGKYKHYIPLRQKWIDALQAGEDPFDDETRMKLRYE
ncbi:MAG: hypothetical protein ACPGWR_19650, partial [Ardenticatenaceae bacterium]